MVSSVRRRPPRLSRRTCLATLGTGLLFGLAGCSLAAGDIASEEVDAPVVGTADGWSRRISLAPTDESVRHFGMSVALADDATTALVSATYHEESDGLKPGPAYVLEPTDSGWRQQGTLAPTDGDSDMGFGWKGGSTALSGDGTIALVGADKADEPTGAWSGAAYVFERSDGTWGPGSKLVPDDGDKKDFFGKSVALAGDGRIALIGAWGARSAYVFERTDSGWSQQATLVPDDEMGGTFGWSVTLSGDATTAIIGAPGADDPNGEDAGAVYVFHRDGGTWRQQSKLAAADGDTGDFFGGSVTLAGDTAIVGAPEDDDPNGERAGSAYVFERSDGAWSQQTKIVPDDGDRIDLFGVAVALTDDGTTALVGARVDEDPNGRQAGSAYIFERTDDAWSQQVKLAAEDNESHVFGRSVALQGDTAFIGTSHEKAYVFQDAEEAD